MRCRRSSCPIDPGVPRLPELGEIEAIRLFVDRARAARPDFELTETNAESVDELCVRLDGLPLALELAAARCNLLSPRALLERLDARLDLLRAAPGSGMPERQWTLRGAIDWSYELLQPAEQQLFTSLAVFVGGFTLGAAEPVRRAARPRHPGGRSSAPAEQPARDRASTRRRAAPGRARDHPRVRARAARGARRRRAVRRRHATSTSSRPRGPSRAARAAAARVARPARRRAGNIRAALTWAMDAGEAEVGLGSAAALWRFWQLRSHVQEGRERMEELLALGSGSPATRAKAQTMIANAGAHPGRPRDGATNARGEPSVHRREGDARMVANALGLLGWTALMPGRPIRRSRDPGGPRGAAGEQSLHGVGRPSGKSASASRCAGSSTMPSERSRRPSTWHGSSETPGASAVAEVTRGPCIDARRSRTGRAAVRREPGHPPKPGRRMGCLALSLTPRISRARGG